MPDQEAQLVRFCEQQGWVITEKYYEPGASAKSTARKVFREMMNDASAEGDPPFDKILIHNSSRFARSMKDYMLFEALLHHRGIEILSITQTFAKDVGGMVALRMTNLMDEFHSRRSSEDSMRTRHAMIEKGFWPGGVSPHGYKCVPSALNAQRSILAIDEDERGFVELVYKWAVYGDGNGAPMGVKAIVRAANEHGYRTRSGSRWSIQGIYRMLTHEIYYGDYHGA
jgi:DNA invertase Pin-like site-specific DNA recombinase